MNVFIVGATGYIGRAVTRSVLNAGHSVTALARSEESAARLPAGDAQVVSGEVEDLSAIEKGLEHADAVKPGMVVVPPRNDGATICCPRCGRSFQPVGRQRACSTACRQALSRRRHAPALPAIPSRSPRATTVYCCPDCQTH
jgi:hypothetical protein